MFRTSLLCASLMLCGVCASYAQGPLLDAPRFEGRGPALFGPENFQDPAPIPAITPEIDITPRIPSAGGAIVVPGIDAPPMAISDCVCELYDRVCYKDKKRIAPCAVPMIVSVIDPCTRKSDCEVKCVQVKICVPTCGCPKVKISRNGRHTRYDYGKYAIDIYSNRNGSVTVDYDA